MSLNLVTLNTAAEFICFLVGLVFLLKDKDPAWRLFIGYLFATFIGETVGLIMRRVLMIANLQLYNGVLVIECAFVSFFFYHLFKPYGDYKRWLFAWYAVFALGYVCELVFKPDDFVSISASAISIVFVLACLWFYYLKLNDARYEPLLSSASFWWVSGALFFYFGSTACNIFFDYLVKNEVSTYNNSVRYLIFNVLNIILYSFWCVTSVCRYLQRK